MERDVQLHPAFAAEAKHFARDVQIEIAALSGLLAQFGQHLWRPRCDSVKRSPHASMKELRFSLAGAEWRIPFAIDAERRAILLVGRDISDIGERQFYRDVVPVANRRFTAHLMTMARQRPLQ